VTKGKNEMSPAQFYEVVSEIKRAFARASNGPSDLYIEQPEDHSQTTSGGKPHWHIIILDARVDARGEESSAVANKFL